MSLLLLLRRQSQSHARTATDTVALADAVARAVAQQRTAVDTVVTSDAIAHTAGGGAQNLDRTATDTTTLTDDLIRIQHSIRGPPDTVTTADAIAGALALSRTATDTTSVTDEPARLVARTVDVTDTTSTTDAVSREGAFARSHADSTSVTDAATAAGVFGRTAVDTLSTTDAVDSDHRGPDQVLVPNETISGDWVREDGNPATPLHPALGDASDATYIRSPDPADVPANFAEVGLADATDPQTDQRHRVTYRLRTEGSAGVVVELRQGSTVVASWSHAGIAAATDFEQDLSEAEAAQITDYADLRIRARAV